ncbi:urease accessory protein [Methylobacillus rhizosphaerae]|uniref:Urease accessory protein n=1 Tax=Methylobacillus rhizosphaerae TaxID=551994 RepID=A0A238YEB7_9PROT|nr:HupE/UreJ family protein [Methylobacillus rhizosphaerae]SNR69626.1 urease accessory protein [Methylobacillus rhizosphaerae]
MKIARLAALGLLVFSPLALAHPGHAVHGFSAGFMHPLTGLDHLLVMLAVGVWAGKIGGAARWQLPLTFVVVMALGALLGMTGYSLAPIETLLAASVMALGVLLVVSFRLPRLLQLGLVALFAVLHGLAHGAELSSGQGAYVMLGMLLATALLHGVGVSLSASRLPRLVQSVIGCTMIVLGACFLAV